MFLKLFCLLNEFIVNKLEVVLYLAMCVLDGVPLSPDALRNLQACPFCQHTFHRRGSLREHIRFCHERDGGHYRAQMERHMGLNSQVRGKVTHWKKYKIF